MAFHHVAFATRNLDATHRFYTDVMGFTVTKVVAAPTPEGGWAKHVFYDTGGGEMIAFWDIHDAAIEAGSWTGDLSRSIGLPEWVNHMAFAVDSLDALDAMRERWRRHDITVTEIDHGFCTSIYAMDPNHIMVEFCCTTRPFTQHELADAARLVADPAPELEAPPEPRFYSPTKAAATTP